MADDEKGGFFGDSSTEVTRTTFQEEKPTTQKIEPTPKSYPYTSSPTSDVSDEELFSEFAPKSSSQGLLTVGMLALVLAFILYGSLYFLKFFEVYDFSKTIGVAIFAPVDGIFGAPKKPEEVEFVALSERDIEDIRQRFPTKAVEPPRQEVEIVEEVAIPTQVQDIMKPQLPVGVQPEEPKPQEKPEAPKVATRPTQPKQPVVVPEVARPPAEPVRKEVKRAPVPTETKKVAPPPPKPATKPEPRTAPVKKPVVKPKATPAKVEYTLQVGSFVKQENAFATKKKLMALGYTPELRPVDSEVDFWFVHIGEYNDIAASERILNILGDLDLSGTIVSTKAGSYSIEVGGYVEKSKAEHLLRKLEGYGYKGDVISKKYVKELQQVRVGRYSSKELASTDMEKLQSAGMFPAIAVY